MNESCLFAKKYEPAIAETATNAARGRRNLFLESYIVHFSEDIESHAFAGLNRI